MGSPRPSPTHALVGSASGRLALAALLVAAAAVGSGGALLGGGGAGGAQEEPFPHERHAGLFPLCTGCHAGVADGRGEAGYPAPALCARCHDGVQEERVSWDGARPRTTNVRFDHVVHAGRLDDAGDPQASCESCHAPADGERMRVDSSEELDTCWSCHAHETVDHLAPSASCESCHVPLAETTFGPDRIAGLPRPSSHEREGFVAEVHGDLASGFADRCATCHTQDRCLTCHVDGSLVEIVAIPLAPPGMVLPATSASYPQPPSHLDEGWLDAHRAQVPVRDCSTCHTQDDCRSCHVGIVPSFVEALPLRDQVVAPGVGLETRAPDSHASLFFLDGHAVLAAADGQSCATCHEEAYCVACHDDAPAGGYHPASFVSRHAAEGFARQDECATCHSTEVFCRGCHVDLGLGSRGALGSGYHDAEPIWLLRHGQAARQTLESCASCHSQNDCVQCHGVLGAFSVSPHTREFDAAAAWARSPRTCLACHVRDPLERGR